MLKGISKLKGYDGAEFVMKDGSTKNDRVLKMRKIILILFAILFSNTLM